MRPTIPPSPWIPVTLLLFALLSLATMARLGLALDEAYYWYWAKHPDLGYVDHPPMVAWIGALSTALGGDREFFVRLGGFLLVWAGFAFAFLTVRRLFPREDSRLAWEVLLVLNLTLIFPGASMVYTIDSALFGYWMAALYFGARVVADGDGRAWYGLGLCLGLGMLSKYTMVLLVPGVLGFLLLSPPHRFWLARREPWLSALLALVVFSPVLIWNWGNGWLSFAFQLNQGFTPDQEPVLDKLLDYLGGQAGIVSPLLFLAFLVYGGWGVRLALRPGESAYRYLALLSWPLILFFAYTGATGGRAEANWPAPAYAAGLMLAWVVYRRHFAARRGHRAFAVTVLGVSLLLSLLVRLHLLTQALPIPPERDRVREAFSWDRLGAQVEGIIRSHPGAAGWFLVGDKGTRLAEAVFYTGNRYPGLDLQLPHRYLFLEQPNARFKGMNAVIIARDSAENRAFYGRYFREIIPLEPFEHRYKGVSMPQYGAHLFLGREFLGNWEEFDDLKERR